VTTVTENGDRHYNKNCGQSARGGRASSSGSRSGSD